MKKPKRYLLLFFLLISCSTIRETRNLSRCEFRYDRMRDLQIAGIMLEDIKAYEDLSWMQIGTLSAAVFSGDLPVQMTLILEARNPNSRDAALNQLEYILYLDDDVALTRGSVDRRIVIPPGERVFIPISAELDLLDIFDLSRLESIINLVLSLTERPGHRSRLTIKVKPSVLIGKKPVYYPGYIRITQEFGDQVP